MPRYPLTTLLLLIAFAVAPTRTVLGQNQRAQSPSQQPYATGSIVIKFKPNAQAQGFSAEFTKALTSVAAMTKDVSPMFPHRSGKIAVQSTAIDQGLDRIVLVPLKEGVDPLDATSRLKGFNEVEYIEPNYIYHVDNTPPAPNDSLFSAQWYLQNINAPEAWQVTRGDSLIHIGFVDTGVDWNHPDLKNQFAINPKEDINHNGLFDAWPSTVKGLDAHGDSVYGDLDGIDEDGNGFADDVIGYDFVDQASINYGDSKGRDPIPMDENRHGTAVAGVIAAEQNNRIGISGVAPRCKLVALRAFDFSGNAEDDDIAAAIVYAADNNVRILNLSFGDAVPSLLQRDAIRYATSRGVLVFASSGNSGGDARHYPSDFDDVVSVGATNAPPLQDNVDLFSEYSESLDLVAPGVNIEVPQLGGGYTALSGTSFASPIAAATAALIWSARPGLSPIEVRSILASTTKDISFAGYDHYAANGRIDALAAVTYPGSAAIKITSPGTDDGFRVGDTINVTGYAMSTLFKGYSVSYAPGANPDHAVGSILNNQSVWILIDSSRDQISGATLAKWNTSGLAPGIYTLRLAVASTDQRSTEERIQITLAGAAPVITQFAIDTIYINEKRGLQVRATSDVETYCTLHVRPIGDGPFTDKSDDRFLHAHGVVLSSTDAPIGVPLEIRCVIRDLAGDTTVVTSSAMILEEGVSQRGFVEKSYTLPPGLALDSVLPIPSGDQVVMNVFTDGVNFGPIEMFQFDGAQRRFVRVDSAAESGVPRGIGNTTGDGKPQLLLQNGSRALIYEGSPGHPLLGTILSAGGTLDSISAGGLADVDGDGSQAVIGTWPKPVGQGVTTEQFEALKWSGAGFSKLGQMPDTTAAAPGQQFNVFSDQHIVSADFLGDGKKQVITIDEDADVIGSKRDKSSPDGFSPFFVSENDGFSEGSLLATGDFNNDGHPDLAFAYHRGFLHGGAYNEYAPNYWTLKVYLNNGDGTFTLNTVENFTPIRDPSDISELYRAGLASVANVTGHSGNDLALSIFPNFYLLEFDKTSNKVKPVWQYPLSITSFGAIAHDFDRNGRTELGFYAGDSIRFFERDQQYATRTQTPGGLEVTPLDSDHVELTWGAVSGATHYNVLRADTSASGFDLLASTAATSYRDTVVTNHAVYYYSVTAVDPTMADAESLPAFSVLTYVHPRPRLDSLVVSSNNIVAHSTEPLQTSVLDGGALIFDDSILCSSVIVRSDSTLVLSPSAQLGPGLHSVRVNSTALRDLYRSPFDLQQRQRFMIDTSRFVRKFFIVRWQFLTNARIHITFNYEPGDDALLTSHYSMSPYGRLIRVVRDTLDTLSVYADLDPSTPIVALGVPFVLCISGIHDIYADAIEPTEGNCVGETLTESDLTHALVYPNPAKASSGGIMFARLTAQAEISIYTQQMRFVRRIETQNKTGGVLWDMKDENGNPLPSGIYLYSITGRDDDGNTVPTQAAKLVIINDQ